MFIIDNEYRVRTTLPVIIDNYAILHFDEYPILFSGTNKYGNKILGSLSYEEDDIFRYFMVLLDDKQYSDFINRKKSYLDLIQLNQEVFVVDKDINEKEVAVFQVPVVNIPTEYLPHPNSYISEQKVLASLSFGFGLKGKLADLHKAFVNDINNVNQKIYEYLQESLDALRSLSIFPVIYSQPSRIGSYRLNFDIEFKQVRQLDLFPVDDEKIKEFINSYLNYVAYLLPDENDDFLNSSPEDSANFQSLKESLLDVYKSGGIPSVSTINDRLVENINNSANKLLEVTEYLKSSESFNKIELGNYDDKGVFSTVGYLTDDYKDSVSSKLLTEEALLIDDIEVEYDPTPQDYRILVYQLNLYTGKGRARLYYHQEDYYNIRILVEKGDKELSNSIYTKSLDEDKVVDVKGIAVKISGVYKKLDCYL